MTLASHTIITASDAPIVARGEDVRAIIEGRKTQMRLPLSTERWPRSLDKRPAHRGKRIWIREAWRTVADLDGCRTRHMPAGTPVWYDADGPSRDPKWSSRGRPSTQMPRWASRLVITLSDVRPDRLHDVTRSDIEAEGLLIDPRMSDVTVLSRFSRRWDERYAKRLDEEGYPFAWEANPWVWVLLWESDAVVVRQNQVGER